MYVKVVMPVEGQPAAQYLWDKVERLQWQEIPLPDKVDALSKMTKFSVLSAQATAFVKGELRPKPPPSQKGNGEKEGPKQEPCIPKGVLLRLLMRGDIKKEGARGDEERVILTDGVVYILSEEGKTIERIYP